MPYLDTDVFQYFKKEIEAAANLQIKTLKDEIEDIKKKQIAHIDEDVHDGINRALETELNELNTDHSASMNRIKTNTHQEIIKKKKELLDSVILEVQKKCLHFVKTKKYQNGMLNLVKKIDKEFCGENFLFRIKQDDNALEDIITNNYSKNHVIEKVDYIKIGGFIGICTEKGILTDQTIDSKLEERRTWFYENSKLAVKQ